MRAHIYQARSLIGSDASGLSDPFGRWTRSPYCQDFSNIVSESNIYKTFGKAFAIWTRSPYCEDFSLSQIYMRNLAKYLPGEPDLHKKTLQTNWSLNPISKRHVKHIRSARPAKKTFKMQLVAPILSIASCSGLSLESIAKLHRWNFYCLLI